MFSRVTPEVVALLSTHAAIDAFGLTRRSSQDNALANPLVSLVTGEPEGEDWREMRSRIQTILTRDDANQAAQLPVELFFGRLQLATELAGSATSMADPSLSAASMGDELSVAALTWATGSVGGFIRLTADVTSLAVNDPRRTWVEKTYALTCHHVVRPTCPRFVEGQNTGERPLILGHEIVMKPSMVTPLHASATGFSV